MLLCAVAKTVSQKSKANVVAAQRRCPYCSGLLPAERREHALCIQGEVGTALLSLVELELLHAHRSLQLLLEAVVLLGA